MQRKTRFIFTLAWWHLRGQPWRVRLCIFCLALGVAARVGVGTFLGQVDMAIAAKARPLLMADVDIRSTRSLSPVHLKRIRQVLPQDSLDQEMLSMLTMVSSFDRDRTRLSELRVVAPDFPFYGDLMIRSNEGVFEATTVDVLFQGRPKVFVQPELLLQMELALGDAIWIGKESFTIAGVLEKEPGLGASVFSLGPRVMIARTNLKRTGLIGSGARVNYHRLVQLPPRSDVETVTSRLHQALGLPSDTVPSFRGALGPGKGIQIKTYLDAGNQVSRLFDRLGDYLRAVALMALFLGGVGIASLMRGFLHENLEAIAVWRTLGATASFVRHVILIQGLLFGVLSSFLGILLGVILPHLGMILLQKWLPFPLPWHLSFAAIGWGMVLGLVTTILFLLWPVSEILHWKPLEVFRGRVQPVGPTWARIQLLGTSALLFTLFAIIETRSISRGLFFFVVFSGGIGVLYGMSRLLLKPAALLRFFFKDPGLRLGLSNLGRPGLRLEASVICLGVAALALGMTFIYQASLQNELDPGLGGAPLPNLFLIDLQPPQVERMEDVLEEQGIPSFRLSPMIKARYRGKNGEPLEISYQATREGERAYQMRHREQNLSYREALGSSERITEGQWLSEDTQTMEASLETWFADQLGVELGDQLLFDVQGIPLEVTVTSLRKVDWTSFEPNFFILVTPHALQDAPASWVGSVAGLDAEGTTALAAHLAREFPNVSLFNVERTGQKIMQMMQQALFAIRGVALFLFGSGLLVLLGMIFSSMQSRRQELSLLKVVGGGSQLIMRAFLAEFSMVAILACILGGGLSIAFSWFWMEFELNMVLTIPWVRLLTLYGVLIAMTAGLGIWSCRRVFDVKPMLVLRET